MFDLAGPFCGDGLEEPDPAALFIHAGGRHCDTPWSCGGNVRLHFSLKEVEQWNL